MLQVPCYGTLLTEHGGGAAENASLLDNSVAVAEKLAGMLEHYAFDGWLVNIEAPLPGGVADHGRLVGFLGKLRLACRSRCAMAKVIIYDSLDARGHVEYLFLEHLYSIMVNHRSFCGSLLY